MPGERAPGGVKTFLHAAEARHNNLDFLRFFFASLVAFTHAFNLLYGEGTDPLGAATDGVVGLGGEAVNFFFVISGYLITRSWLHSHGWRDFLNKRVRRIYPAFAVVVLLCVFVVGPLGAQDAAAYFDALKLKHLLPDLLRLKLMGLPPTFEHNAFPRIVNGSLWTISYEFLCYLLVAALGLSKWLGRRWAMLCLLVCALLVATLQKHVPDVPLPAALGPWPRFLSCFTAGMVFYLYRDRIPYSPWWFTLALLGLVGSVLCLGLVSLATPVFGSYCVLYLAFSRRLGLQRFGRYGDFSYGIYLYAFPIQQLLALYLGPALNGPGMFAVSMLAALCCAVPSWYWVERPFLQRQRRGGQKAAA